MQIKDKDHTNGNKHKHDSNAGFPPVLFEITKIIFVFKDQNITSQSLMLDKSNTTQLVHGLGCISKQLQQRHFGEITYLQPILLNY